MQLIEEVNMIAVFGLLIAGLATVTAVPAHPQRIVGGSLTTINTYPYLTSLLYSWNLAAYLQSCGGVLLTRTSGLTAAHCVNGDRPQHWRIRLGSTYANSGGVIHNVGTIVVHPSYNPYTVSNDVAIIKTATQVALIPGSIQLASIAGTNYNLADNRTVFAVGWGTVSYGGPASEQLQHVQVRTVNQATCRARYSELGWNVSDDMLCAGWLDVGGLDACQGDSGGPLLDNHVVVGVTSWGTGAHQCRTGRWPRVYARVSRFTTWIQNNA